MINISTNTQIGLGLTGFGLTFLCLGVILMFDKGLLAIGNVRYWISSCFIIIYNLVVLLTVFISNEYIQILFLVGLGFIFGFWKACHFFFQWHKIKGTLAFILGIIMVFAGHPVIGIMIEVCGSYLLFSAFIPTVFNYAKGLLPFWGTIKNRSIV